MVITDPVSCATMQFVISVFELVEALGIDVDPLTLTVNFDAGLRRIDIARVTPDGHLGDVLASVGADVSDLATFAKPIGKPTSMSAFTGPMH